MTTPNGIYDPYGYRYAADLCGVLADRLALTRAGAVPTIVHPGNMVPMYGCPLATVRVVSITPGQPPPLNAGGRPCGESRHTVVLEMVVDRCYRTPVDNGKPPDGWLDSYARDILDDAEAMRRAARLAWSNARNLTREIHAWLPRGPEGGIHGGVLQVSVNVVMECPPDIAFASIDDTVERLPDDPRSAS